MRLYRVTFRRTVADDTGHEHRVLKRSLPVRAPPEVSAVWQAEALLGAGARVVDGRPRR